MLKSPDSTGRFFCLQSPKTIVFIAFPFFRKFDFSSIFGYLCPFSGHFVQKKALKCRKSGFTKKMLS